MLTYLLTLATTAAVYTTLVLGLNIQFGYAGILNFAYITFVAIGAYTTGVLTLGSGNNYYIQEHVVHTTVVWPVALLISGIVSSVLSLALIALLMKRLRSDYLAIAMIALGEVVWTLIGNDTSLFNGWDGLVGIPQPFDTMSSQTASAASFFGVTVVVAVFSYLFARTLYRSPLGRVLRAVREDPTVAESFGRSVGRARIIAFTLGGFLAGVGGGLLGMQVGAWSPNAFTPLETFFLFAALIVGGTASPLGSVVGSVLVLGVIDEITRYIPSVVSPAIVSAFRFILIGVLLLVVLRFRNQGIAPEPNARGYRRFIARNLGDQWTLAAALPELAEVEGTNGIRHRPGSVAGVLRRLRSTKVSQ